MKINNIQPTQYSFKANYNDYVSKKMLKAINEKQTNTLIATADVLSKYTALLSLSGVAVNEMLKKYGFTYCDVSDNRVSVNAGYNGGFYSLKIDGNYTPDILKAFFAKSLSRNENIGVGGILNYKDMVADLKRQDIIQKGLQIHTYELNTNVTSADAERASKRLSKLVHKYIKPKDLFFIDDDVYYYDQLEKKAYCINLSCGSYSVAADTFRVCTFITDEKNNTIGYTENRYDIYRKMRINKKYKEQQEVSENLPDIADNANNKIFAEAFRFGNAKQSSIKVQYAIPKVLEHLEKRVKINEPNKDMLQIVKFYDNNKNEVTNICFYDSSIGRSLVYDEKGKYLYQMEYNKDSSGNIIACSKY